MLIKTQGNKSLLFNWPFIGGLLLLALNDHVFKWQFANWLTGKVSDFVGLLIFPMFLSFIFPKLKTYTPLLTGLLFIFWKLPISENFINSYNQFSLIPIVRIIDYSDLIALLILPLSQYLITNIEQYRIVSHSKFSLPPLFVLIPTCFLFMATSPPTSYYMKPSGDIHIGKSYKMKANKETILNKLKMDGYVVKQDSINRLSKVDYYLIENVIFNNGKDTIKSIQIGFMGNLLLVNNLSINDDFKMSDWKALRKQAKKYQKLIKSGIVEEIN